MGLRAASVRHPNAGVMAPALTESNQTQNFKISSASHLEPVPTCGIYIDKDSEPLNGSTFNEYLRKSNCKQTEASDSGLSTIDYNIMSNSPPPMGDLVQDNMGLERNNTFFKDKSIPSSDMEQPFGNEYNLLGSSPTSLGRAGDILTSVIPTNDLGHSRDDVDDFLQVFKSMGSTQSDNESVFPLSSTDLTQNTSLFERELLNDVDVIGMCEEEPLSSTPISKETQAKETLVELHRKQAKLERRTEFLLRRLRKIQARSMGQHVSGEIAGLFEHVHRTINRLRDQPPKQEELNNTSDTLVKNEVDEQLPVKPLTPVSSSAIKSLVKNLERSAISQSNNAARQRHAFRYFGSGSLDHGLPTRSISGTLPTFSPQDKSELTRVSGLLQAETSMVETLVDSDATASSSGGESCDEALSYNNPTQQYLSINKRAAWRYAHDRAAVIARWTWLQAQISDLEYKIRQHTDLHRQIRQCKGPVLLGGTSPETSTPVSPNAVNGYKGQLPGASPSTSIMGNTKLVGNSVVANPNDVFGGNDSTPSPNYCTRTRPLLKTFRKRKVLQTTGLHAISKKAARPSTMRCGCAPPIVPCALCTGRTDPTFPRDPMELMTKADRVALLDPGFHPVLSFPEDVPASIHLEALMKLPDWQQKSMRCTIKALKNNHTKIERSDKGSVLEHRPKKPEHRRKYTRHILKTNNTAANLSNKIRNKIISRGRKASRHSNILRFSKKRHTAKVAIAQLQALAAEGADDELEAIGNNIGGNSVKGVAPSPATSPLLTMPSYRKNRINSYDIDNIVIPYSVAASTRVEKLNYKEILTPKWRVVDIDFSNKYDQKNNGIVRKSSQEEEQNEDVSDEAVAVRHDKCEHDEKKKFLSYLKFPLSTSSRSRANRRTDSRAESSGANTPDPMSPHTGDGIAGEQSGSSPITSPPATPSAPNVSSNEEGPPAATTSAAPAQVPLAPISNLPVSNLRRRTISQSRWAKERELKDEPNRCNTPEHVEVAPYDSRIFPLDDDTYDKMLRTMPEGHTMPSYLMPRTPLRDDGASMSPIYLKPASPGSDSTESAIVEEDPNDPEWVDMERIRGSAGGKR